MVSGEGYWYVKRWSTWIQFLLFSWRAGTHLCWKVTAFAHCKIRICFLFTYHPAVWKTSCHSNMFTALCSVACEEASLCAPCHDSAGDWSICCFTLSCSRRCTSSWKTVLVRSLSHAPVPLGFQWIWHNLYCYKCKVGTKLCRHVDISFILACERSKFENLASGFATIQP